MTFPERVRFQKALQAYKVINDICPKYSQNYFKFTNEIYSKNLRSAEKFNLYNPNPNVEIFRKTFAYSGTDIWNSLPNDVKLHYLSKHLNLLVRDVMAIKGLFGSDSSKSTKFGSEMPHRRALDGAAIFAKSFRLDVNHRYKT